MTAVATPPNANAVKTSAKSRMSIPFLEWASYWSGVVAVVLTGLAALAGLFAWFFSSKLSDAKEADRVKLEARIGPRIALLHQKELTARMSQFKDQRGTIVASPSTPESVHFRMALTAALKSAGWEIEQLTGVPGGTLVFPTGIVIQYPFTGRTPKDPQPHTDLAKALNEWGISATVVPTPMIAGNTIEIIVSEK